MPKSFEEALELHIESMRSYAEELKAGGVFLSRSKARERIESCIDKLDRVRLHLHARAASDLFIEKYGIQK